MNIVGHDLIGKYLNHSRSEDSLLVVAVGHLGHGMNGSDVSANLSSMKSSILEIGLGVGVRNIIGRVN